MPDEHDEELEAVRNALINGSPKGERWANVIRRTYDMIYNGRETGRYKWSDLLKTERTHFGTLFEINAQREFQFDGGEKLDFRIEGVEVDAKWSQELFLWMLPPECFGSLVLVAHASDVAGTWSLGLVRVTEDNRLKTSNRDAKSRLNKTGRKAVTWLWRDSLLPPNILLQLPEHDVHYIFSSSSGAERTNRLFRLAEGRIVHRGAVETTGQQIDTQKRVRGNGGSRSALAPEGIIILSGEYHSHLAEDLNVPIPRRGEYISVKVVPASTGEGAKIGGQFWRRATHLDVIATRAPVLPPNGSREI